MVNDFYDTRFRVRGDFRLAQQYFFRTPCWQRGQTCLQNCLTILTCRFNLVDRFHNMAFSFSHTRLYGSDLFVQVGLSIKHSRMTTTPVLKYFSENFTAPYILIPYYTVWLGEVSMNPQIERERWEMYGVSAMVSLFFSAGIFELWFLIWLFSGTFEGGNPIENK